MSEFKMGSGKALVDAWLVESTGSMVFGIDPGLTTGVVVVGIPYNTKRAPEILYAQEIKADPVPTAKRIDNMFDEYKAAIHSVVYETFIGQNHEFAVDPNPSCQLNGIVRWLCHHRGYPAIGRTPGSREAVAESALRPAGYWITGGGGHARQALRHVLSEQLRLNNLALMQRLHPRSA